MLINNRNNQYYMILYTMCKITNLKIYINMFNNAQRSKSHT